MANMTFSNKSLYDFIKSNPSLQLQANFEFRWPLVFKDNSFLVDTLEIPEIDSTQGYMYLDGYQLPVLGTPRFTNTIRLSFWAEEPFMNKYGILFTELLDQQMDGEDSYIIPRSTPATKSLANLKNVQTLHLYDTRLKQITTDEHSASSQALVHVNLTLVFAAYDITMTNADIRMNTSSLNDYSASAWDLLNKFGADSLADSLRP